MREQGKPALERRPERAALPEGQAPFAATSRKAGRRISPLLTWLFSGAAHGLVFTALLWPPAAPPKPTETPPILVSLVEVPKPDPEPPGPPDDIQAKAKGSPDAVPQPRPAPPPKAAPAPTPSPDAEDKPAPDTFSDLLSDSQIAVAASAGEEGLGGGNGGGGSCDMARAVQQALRRDPLVHTAVGSANRLGKAIMLWNGDWVQAGVQDGKGLSAVREAVLWEVGFAPEACRNKQMHGLVLLSLADGSTRFAIGSGDWRWSDLLHVRRVAQER